MRPTNLVLSLFFLLCLTGCGHISPDDEIWFKYGEDRVETRKALLECGLSNPETPIRFTEICMLVSGFRRKGEYDLLFRDYPTDLCNPPHSERPDICDTIPSRDIKKRLNSNYCKYSKEAEYFYFMWNREPRPPNTSPPINSRKETDAVPWKCLP